MSGCVNNSPIINFITTIVKESDQLDALRYLVTWFVTDVFCFKRSSVRGHWQAGGIFLCFLEELFYEWYKDCGCLLLYVLTRSNPFQGFRGSSCSSKQSLGEGRVTLDSPSLTSHTETTNQSCFPCWHCCILPITHISHNIFLSSHK